MTSEEFYSLTKVYTDFPKKGVNFLDLSPVLASSQDFCELTNDIAHSMIYLGAGNAVKVVGIESRGFIAATYVASSVVASLVLCRKKGKLPGEVISQSYEKEYGTDELCIQKGLIEEGDQVVIVDDVLATGGTIEAVVNIVKQFKPSRISVLVLAEIEGLKGREVLDRLGVNYEILYSQCL